MKTWGAGEIKFIPDFRLRRINAMESESISSLFSENLFKNTALINIFPLK